ncbi:MAG TPA: LruC domain-containing protein, partial [Alistipes sp.]|nr:LruC domain-containing protein [Alistipes sp.]
MPGAVPADFDWKTTRNVTVSVSTPVVEGATPPYAVIRIYSSPILSAENLAARGVAKSAMPFRSAFTLNAGTENLYVQTTLPDGTKSVKMVGAHGTVAVTGASMKAAAAPKMRLAANARVGSSMPDYPKMEAPDAASFDSKAVITAIESGKSYQLGASWAFYAAPEYLIPAGAEVAGKLDLNGGFSPYQAPILYVAGKLTLSSLNIGRAKLAVLPGGEVKIGTLKIQPSAADGAALYVFADGKLSVGKPNVSGKCIVNNGTLTVDGSLDMNNGLTVYNTATGVLTVTDEMKVSNSARIYNDGAVTVDDLKINSDGEFHNCENALLVVNDECELERSTAIYQRGRASIEEMTARGTIWVNCHTSVNELEAQGAEFNFSANAGLDAGRVEFNNTNVSMARGAIFTMEEYNADEKGGGNRFAFTGDADPRAVVLISEKAYTRKGHETYFSGAIEVVYDNDRDKDYTIRKDYLTDGAVMSASQTTIITENGCNGGKDPVNPDPEP